MTQESRSTYCDATPSSPYRDIIGFFVVLKLSDRYRLERDVDPADGWLPGSPAKRVASQGWRFPVTNENHHVPAFTGFLRSTYFAGVANFREKCVIRYGYGAVERRACARLCKRSAEIRDTVSFSTKLRIQELPYSNSIAPVDEHAAACEVANDRKQHAIRSVEIDVVSPMRSHVVSSYRESNE